MTRIYNSAVDWTGHVVLVSFSCHSLFAKSCQFYQGSGNRWIAWLHLHRPLRHRDMLGCGGEFGDEAEGEALTESLQKTEASF